MASTLRCERQDLFLYDFSGSLDIEAARRALAPHYAAGDVPAIHGAPEYVTLAPTLLLDFGPRGAFTLSDGTPCRAGAKLFEAGAMSIHFIARTETGSLGELSAGVSGGLRQGERSLRKSEAARELFEEVHARMQGSVRDHYDGHIRPERYILFGIERPEEGASAWVERNRRALAGLLSGEPSPERLSSQEVDEVLNTRFSYYRDDAAMVGTEAAVFVADDLKSAGDVAAILELVCLQRLELRAYDAYLDRVADKAAADVREIFGRRKWRIGRGRARAMVGELVETRADFERLVDEIGNAAKFYGDWYLARFYLGCRRKLHVDQWLQSVEEKLDTVGDLYTLAAGEATNRQLIFLEVLIVLLFLLEIAMALFAKRP